MTGTIRFTLPSANLTPLVSVQSGVSVSGYAPQYAVDFSAANLGRPCLASGFNISLQCDFGVSTFLAGLLLWHNGDDNLTFTIKANSTPSWGSPPFSETVVALPRRGDGRTVKLWKSVGASYRYALIVFPTNSIPPGLKFQWYNVISQLTGDLSGSGQQFQWNSHRPNSQYGIDLTTQFGFHWIYDFMAGSETRTGTLAVTDADAAVIRFWHQATGGRALTMFVPDSNSAEAYLGRIALGPSPAAFSTAQFTSTLDVQAVDKNYNTIQLSIEDMTAGGVNCVK